MNKKFLKHYMETAPEGTAQTYIFLVDNQDIALNIVLSGYQALCLVQEECSICMRNTAKRMEDRGMVNPTFSRI